MMERDIPVLVEFQRFVESLNGFLELLLIKQEFTATRRELRRDGGGRPQLTSSYWALPFLGIASRSS